MEIHEVFDNEVINKGIELVRSGQYKDFVFYDGELSVTIIDEVEYPVKVSYKADSISQVNCACHSPNCVHSAAACVLKKVKCESVKKDNEEGALCEKTVHEQSLDEFETVGGGIELKAQINEFFCYAIQLNNGIHLVQSISISNVSSEDAEDYLLHIEADNEFIRPFNRTFSLSAGESLMIEEVKDIAISGRFLAGVTDTIKTILTFEVRRDEECIISESRTVTIFPYDFWPGLRRYPADLLTAYIIPTHPVLTGVLKDAGDILYKMTGDNAMSGYQIGTKDSVINLAKAVYLSLTARNIQYMEPASSFEDNGQKVRMPEEIEATRMGTCLDITLLYLGCLESAGIDGVVMLITGHAFMGVWLKEDGAKQLNNRIIEDVSYVKKRVEMGDLLLINAVGIASDISFEDAVSGAEDYLIDSDKFNCLVDVHRSRNNGIRPIPVRMMNSLGYTLAVEDKDISEEIKPHSVEVNEVDLSDVKCEKSEMTKLGQWERRLLNLSKMNVLINTKKERVVRIMQIPIDLLEDMLSDDEEFVIEPVIEEVLGNLTSNSRTGRKAVIQFDEMTARTIMKDYGDLLLSDLKKNVLHAWYFDPTSLDKELKKLYKANISSMEETGNSVLYMSLGMLRWKESDEDKKFYHSPIVLMPIDILYSSVNEGVKIRKRDADTVINMTLLELLKQQFNIEIPVLEQLPEDESGLDIKKIFAIVRQAVMNITGWEVLEEASVGIFSFKEFVMWNDIHSHPEFLENHKIVKSLISGVAEWDTSIPEDVDTDIPYLPVSVDASQLRAVNMAANNVSFILQGPPGTGKSQTITAMIANALMKGKRVLFVAEKEAALNVVADRLKGIGLEDFCLGIYGKNESKRRVLDQIGRNMQLRNLGMHTEYETKLKELTERKAYLDAYAYELHKTLDCGLSIRQLIEEYEGIEDTVAVPVPDDYIDSCVTGKLDEAKRLLKDLVEAGKNLGHPKDSHFKDVRVGEYSQSFKRDLEETTSECSDILSVLEESGRLLAEKIGKCVPGKYSEWSNLADCAKAVCGFEATPAFLFGGDDPDELFSKPITLLEEIEKTQAIRQAFLMDWKEELLAKDMNELARRFEEANKKILGKAKALQAINNELAEFSENGSNVFDVAEVVESVNNCLNQINRLESLKAQIDIKWNTVLEKYNSVELLTEYKDSIIELTAQSRAAGIDPSDIVGRNDHSECLEAAKVFLERLESLADCEKRLGDLLGTSFVASEEEWIETKQRKLDEIRDNTSALRDWIEFRGIMSRCESAGLGFMCENYLKGLDHEKLIPAFFKNTYKSLIWKAMDELPDVNKFNGNTFNERVRQYKDLDDEFIQVTREEILYKLRLRTPSAMSSVQKGLNGKEISRAIKSGGRGTSIRKLMSERFATIITCCPCMLMTPLTVAKFIPPENDVFDLVIFDEASQLPTAQAVGTIARGKNAVIVGDQKQMPPTSFFNSKYEDYENIDLEDLESILEDCQVIGMPDTRLEWHYRSRHESLIAFSNRYYYDNNMLTFPSVNDRERRITLITVNGEKKNNVNDKEARKVVEEVLRRYKDERLNKKSVGIVTFNISQRRYIEKLLAEEYAKDPALETWANPPEDERKLFVKNLENVQGDERDVILFSMTFGYDDKGVFSINFGPLNKEGGERRLNVAVSRSKEEMVIFSSMTSDMISAKGTLENMSKGVQGVYNFLRYAETGELPDKSENEEAISYTQGIKKHIINVLEENGYKVKTDLGFSEFKIDVAVVDPGDGSEYILGIMLDGESYRIAGNTRDREVAQINVLKGLGWNIYRIWTMDWWDDKNREIKKLLTLMEKLVDEHKTRVKEEWNPESEAIVPRTVDKEKHKKKKEEEAVVYLTEERFHPAVPHTDSVEQFKKEEVERVIDKLASELLAGTR